MLLTIGMIVKNEEKYLKACLDAISPILDRVDCELIIADTGSDDSTVEIAKAFTDKVFHFDWCDDFSAARNATVERAKGKWYMALDADEIFEDVQEILDFFISGEYQKFNSATYLIRSYNDEAHKIYTDYNAPRIFRLGADSRYHNRIHEEMPYYHPIKQLHCYAIHYGYLLENNEEFIHKKTQRNLELLLLELEKEPNNCKHYLEIGQVYDLLHEYETALEYFKKGLVKALKHKNPKLKSCYAEIARMLFELKKNQEILDVTVEYFNIDNKKNPIDLQMHFLRARSFYEIKQYREAILSFERYIEAYRLYQQNGYEADAVAQYVVRFTDTYNYRTACVNLVHSCMEEKEYNTAKQYLSLIPIADWILDDRGIQKRLALEINLMGEMSNYSCLPDLFKNLSGNALILLQDMIEHIVNEERRNLILAEVAGSDLIETDYIRLLKLRYRFLCEHTLTSRDVNAFFSEIEEFVSIYADVLYYAVSLGFDLGIAAERIDAYELELLLANNKSLHFNDFPERIYQLCERNSETPDPRTQLFLSILYMWALKHGQFTERQLSRLFDSYAETSDALLTSAFQEEFLSEKNIRVLPKNLRIGYYSAQAVSNKKRKGDSSSYIQSLKTILRIEPGLKDVIKVLLDEFKNEMNLEAAHRDPVSEFETYAAIVKANIKKLISENQGSQAAEIIAAYEQLCPEDPEIQELKKHL
jgi:glycosyltransferase involved in cell wall biosynthesis